MGLMPSSHGHVDSPRRSRAWAGSVGSRRVNIPTAQICVTCPYWPSWVVVGLVIFFSLAAVGGLLAILHFLKDE